MTQHDSRHTFFSRVARPAVPLLFLAAALGCTGTFGPGAGPGGRLTDQDAETAPLERPDAGPPPVPDAAVFVQPDASIPDLGSTTYPDAAPPDAGHPDAAPRDAGHPDAAQPDAGPPTLEVPITVKEVAGVGCTSCLVTAVVPLPRGRFQDTHTLRVVDPRGQTVPAQLEVMNRNWVSDQSLRHVAVHFQPTVAAFTGPGTGQASYTLQDVGGTIAPATPVTVTENGTQIVVTTGAASFTITTQPFSIQTPAGPLEGVFTRPDGTEERSFAADDIITTIEERGPVRAVIRAESPAKVIDGQTRHGWALRLYVAAGESGLKVDFQLQNSARNTVVNGPLYFDAFVLRLSTGVAQAAQSVRAAGSDTNPVNRAPGSIDAGSVQAIIRHFWEQWPNGLAVDAAGTLSIELFPSWSARPYPRETPSTSGLHWLNDMQHVVKEVYLRFGTATAGALEAHARSFQFHPVASLPVSWYADTQVTLDQGGAFPARQRLGTGDVRRPDYTKYNNNVYITNLAERFGYSNFGIDYVRKAGPSTAGGWPYSSAAFFLTQDPADYYASEDLAMGELNVMPEWLTRYEYATDFERLLLTENPYGGYSWRRFDGTYGYAPVPGYLAGSGQDAKPRDDQHAWFYHVEEAYFATDNLWIRDWYGFIAQFRRTRVNQRDPFPDMSGRAAGHAISHALQAYRVTGDVALYQSVGAYLRDQVAPLTDPVLGGIAPRADYPVEAVFQLGYLARSLISYLEEKPAAQRDPVVLATVAGLVRWNESYGLFGYYTAVDQANTTSSGTAMTFGDPQGWYAVQGPGPAAMTQLRSYVDTGIGVGGERPYVDLRTWTGDFNGRLSSKAFTLFH